MSDSPTIPTPDDVTPDVTPDDVPTGTGTGRVSPRTARIVGRGLGTWSRATTRRVPVSDAGFTPDAASRVARPSGRDGTSADVRMSPAADAAVAAVVAAHASDDVAVVAIHAAAAEHARNRGSRRVWDIDVAAAIGFAWTPDGAGAFRAAYGIPARSVAASWPARVSETPYDATPRGTVVNPATGAIVTP